ncbi:MAG: phosphoribosylaminoimidazolecarboxamide formyltransferase [Planctomycetota bacterium]|jgi:phosphoribosylaminoimidazolecarboxamide formyltransferase/IMP cyclohydrolase
MELKYGCNPHQSYASVEPLDSASCPVELLNGKPSMINFLDALNAWQLVHELRKALGMPAATSFKHVSPAGAAVAVPLDDELARMYEVEGRDLTPAATAYVRARNADPKSSFGDFAALSDPVDVDTANFLKGVVCDGIVAPGYDPKALEILKAKKKGGFTVMRADPDFSAPAREAREVFGMKLVQDRNNFDITLATLENVVCGQLTDDARRDLVLGQIAIKYTQSNSVGYALGGQMIGVGAGQQSRVDCTKLAGSKADVWHLRRHPRIMGLKFRSSVKRQERINWRIRLIEGQVTAQEQKVLDEVLEEKATELSLEEKAEWVARLDGVSMASDAFIPFRDNIDHAQRHGVKFICHPGGAVRDEDVKAACEEYGIAMAYTGVRLFHH